MNKKIWSAPIALIVVLVTALVFGGITVSADTVAEGECGAGVTWTLDSEGVLTISGSGAMDDFQYYDYQPWYSVRDNIKRVVVEDGITAIGTYAFLYCGNITSADISSDVTSIGDYAFASTGLTSATIPVNVTFGLGVYSNCQQLTSATIEEGVTTINYYTFDGCTSLTSVSIPSSVNCVLGGAFAYTGFTSVTIPVAWTTVGSDVFYSCADLTEVIIEPGVTTIPDSAFSNCTALTSIELPDSVTTIGVSAFSRCGFEEFIIPSHVTTINNGAFSYTPLKSITIPASVTSLGTAVFIGCKDLKSATIAEGITSVPDYTFMDCNVLESVTIPSSVETLGMFSLANTAIKSFDFTGNYKSIGADAFFGCSKLTSVTFCDRNDTLTLGGSVFSNSGLTSVVIPSYLTGTDWQGISFVGINDNMFDGCNDLTHVEIKEGVKHIGYRAFAACKSLETVIIPSTIEYIQGDAFCYTSNLANVYCYAEPGFEWQEKGDDFITSTLKLTKFHVLGNPSEYSSLYPSANVTFVGETDFSARVVGHSVTLSADIGLNFFIRLPEEYNSNNTEVTFSWGLDNKATTAKGQLVSVNQHGANYKVTCNVAAYFMADNITMVVKSGNTELLTDTYSIERYINVLALSHYYDQDQSLNDLLAAMVLYGNSAQEYFNYRSDYNLIWYTQVNQYNIDRLYDYRNSLKSASPDANSLSVMGIDSDEMGIKSYGASVLCGSQNKIRIYFEIKDPAKISNLTASYGSQGLTFKTRTVNGVKLVYIETPGLAAGEIEQPITVTINGSAYTYDFRYYIQQCVAKNSEQKFADCACDLYAVSHYARIYQGGLSNG